MMTPSALATPSETVSRSPQRPQLAAVRLSVVVPVYNEEDNIGPLVERLTAILDDLVGDHEIIFALDPCTDATEERILALHERDPRVKLITFARRVGQPAATLAGLQHATGDPCVVIDADLQDPPELIRDMLCKWQEGDDVVAAQRRSRRGETLIKRIVAYAGYSVINRVSEVPIPRNTGDFRLLSRRVVHHLGQFRESHGFLRGLVALVGFRQTVVQFDRQARSHGKGHYNRFFGSLRIGLNGIFGFSRWPLQMISICGLLISAFSILVGITYTVLRLIPIEIPWGNPTLVIILTMLGGIQLLSLGIIGEYLGRIYDEVKRRPMYIVDRRVGITETTDDAPRDGPRDAQ